VLKQDADDTVALYGKELPFARILAGSVPPPAGTQVFLSEVRTYFRESKGQAKGRSASARPASSGTTRASGGTSGTTTATPENQPQTGSAGTSGSVGARSGSTSSSRTATTTETTNSDSSASSADNMSTDQVKSKIQSALQNTPNLSANNVNVDVTADSVVLSGSVPNDTARGTVERIARENAGGRKVVSDNLNVK
jgi:osmotically-inducible protein OsmY